MDKEIKEKLELLRKPFEPNQIGKLPKPTRNQTEAVKLNQVKVIKCRECGGWHHPNVIHLDYVGHAALTDRLLDVDPEWSWEPMALTDEGLPRIDDLGGLWIRLTILGVMRLGYGCADGKTGGDAVKEIIGDALRNAAMRFGAALELWHKGDLKPGSNEPEPEKPDGLAKPSVDIKRLQTAKGMEFIASFESPEDAVKQARMTNAVSQEEEEMIHDIWHAKRGEQ